MSKFTEPVLHPPPPPGEIERAAEARRHRDGVSNMAEGFHFRPSGRDGFIYYRRGLHVLELYWEMSGNEAFDILLSLDGIRHWHLPDLESIGEDEQRDIAARLREWLQSKNLRASFE